MMEPMRAWELEAGSPRYQVPRFQIIAEINNAKTMAKPAPDPTFNTSSTGRSDSTPKATAPLGSQYPDEIPAARPNYRHHWLETVGVDDRGDRVCGVMEPVDELETQSQSECEKKENTTAKRYGFAEKLHSAPWTLKMSRDRMSRREATSRLRHRGYRSITLFGERSNCRLP